MRISDWSSDVCSSDLVPIRLPAIAVLAALVLSVVALGGCPQSRDAFVESAREPAARALPAYTGQPAHATVLGEIGRASCRERVCQYVSISVVAVSLNKIILIFL